MTLSPSRAHQLPRARFSWASHWKAPAFCNNPLIQLRAAANDIGIAELTCFLGDTSPDLVRVWPRETPAHRTVWLIVHQDMRHSARIRVVSTAIGDIFRRRRKILETGESVARSKV